MVSALVDRPDYDRCPHTQLVYTALALVNRTACPRAWAVDGLFSGGSLQENRCLKTENSTLNTQHLKLNTIPDRLEYRLMNMAIASYNAFVLLELGATCKVEGFTPLIGHFTPRFF